MKTICRKKSLTAAGCETQAGGLAETQERGSHPAYWWRVLVGKGSCLSGKRKSKDRHVFGQLFIAVLLSKGALNGILPAWSV